MDQQQKEIRKFLRAVDRMAIQVQQIIDENDRILAEQLAVHEKLQAIREKLCEASS